MHVSVEFGMKNAHNVQLLWSHQRDVLGLYKIFYGQRSNFVYARNIALFRLVRPIYFSLV